MDSLVGVLAPLVFILVLIALDTVCHASTQQEIDHFYMQRAAELARQAIGQTFPNPCVGCVIVNNGQVVGEGFHRKSGEAHAEVLALRMAGDLARGGTAYVSLEPCNHFGRTPPCTQALITHGLKRVVAGMVDPDPRVSGKGLDTLRAAGIGVSVGVEEKLCQENNAAFVYRTQHRRCYSVLIFGLLEVSSYSANEDVSMEQKSALKKALAKLLNEVIADVDVVVFSSSQLDRGKFDKPVVSSNRPIDFDQENSLLCLLDAVLPSHVRFAVCTFDSYNADKRQKITTEQASQIIEGVRAFSRSNFAKEHNPGGLRPWIVIDSTVALDALNRESPSTCFGEDSDIEFSRIEVGGDIRQLLVTRHQSNAALFIASNGFTFEKIQESIGDDSIQRVVVMGIEKLVGQQLATDPTEILGSSDQTVFRGHRCEEMPRLVSEMLPESLVPSFGSTSSRLSARCYPIWAPAIGSNLH